MNNTKYWFYLESFTFIFTNQTEILIYNSFGKSLIKFNLTKKIESIVKDLNKNENMYAIPMTDMDLLDDKVKDFVDGIRNSFAGDLIPQALFKNKPVIMPPVFNVQTSDDNLMKGPDISTERNPSPVLNELTLYVTGICPLSCKHCDEYRKQFTFCHKKNKTLEIEAIDKTLRQVSNTRLKKINVCGGDIFSYKQWDKLLELMDNNTYQKTFFSHYLNINLNSTLQVLNLKNTTLNILVNFPIEEKKLEEIISSMAKKMNLITWTFIIDSKIQYEKVEEIVSQKKIDNYSLKPFFTGTNMLFFKKNIFLNEEDIYNSDLSRNEIYARQVINTFDFGKLIINEDGLVFANQNDKSVGNINDNLLAILTKELVSGKTWKRTRLKIEPCKDCIYNLLCPSPSNYELVIGKNNLCNV